MGKINNYGNMFFLQMFLNL